MGDLKERLDSRGLSVVQIMRSAEKAGTDPAQRAAQLCGGTLAPDHLYLFGVSRRTGKGRPYHRCVSDLRGQIRDILFHAEIDPDTSGGGRFVQELVELTGQDRELVVDAIRQMEREHEVTVSGFDEDRGGWVVRLASPGASLA